MPDTAFRLVFWLISGAAAVILLLCVIGAVFHLAAFGAIFGIVARRIRAAHAEEAAARRTPLRALRIDRFRRRAGVPELCGTDRSGRHLFVGATGRTRVGW